MPRVNVRLPAGLHDDLLELIEDDEYFSDKSDATRYALRQLVQRQHRGDEE